MFKREVERKEKIKTPGKPTKPYTPALRLPLHVHAQLSQSHVGFIITALLICLCLLPQINYFLLREGASLKREITSDCLSLQAATNALASTPQQVATAITNQINRSVMLAEKDATKTIIMSLELTKEVLLYVLLRYQKVIQCLLFLSVSAGLGALAENAVEITSFVNGELQGMQATLTSSLATLNGELTTVNNDISHIPSFAGISIPQIPNVPFAIPGLQSQLQGGWQLPNGTVNALSSLTGGPASLQILHDDISSLISSPIDTLISSLNQSITTSLSSLNISKIPLPSMVSNIEFCNEVTPAKEVDTLMQGMESLITGMYITLSVLIVITLLVSCFLIMREEKREMERREGVSRVLDDYIYRRGSGSHQFNVEGRIVWGFQNPKLQGVREGRFLRKYLSKPWQGRVIWLLTYLTHNPLSMGLLIIGSIGYTFIQLQVLLLPYIFESLLPTIAKALMTDTTLIYDKVDAAINGVVGPYINAINGEVNAIEGEIDTLFFGWINQTLSTLEGSVDTLFTAFKGDLDKVLGGFKPLETVVDDFFVCIVGNITQDLSLAIGALESVKGKTDLGIDVGMNDFQFDVISLLDPLFNRTASTGNSSSVLSTLSTDATTFFEGRVEEMLNAYLETLQLQSIPFLVMLGCGGSIVLFGLGVILWDFFYGCLYHTSSNNDANEKEEL